MSFNRVVFFPLVFILILSRCSNPPFHYRIVSNDFEHLDFPSAPFDLNYHWKGNTHFYSFDFHTQKKLRSFSKNGRIDFSIDLKPLLQEVDASMYHACIINPDTIVILSHSNNIYLIDWQGAVKKKFSLTKLTSTGLIAVPSCCLKGDDLTFSLHNKKGINSPGNFDSLNKSLHHLPIMASVNLKSGDLTLKGEKILPRFLKDDEIDPEGVKTIPYFQGYIYSSVFSDSIYLLSEKGKVLKVKKLQKENNRQAYLNHIKLKDAQNGKINTTEVYLSGSYITSIVYMPSVHYFAVLIREPQTNGKHFPLRLLILNEAFETIKEFTFAAGLYSPVMLAESNGVYMRKINPDPKKHIYDFIEFN